MMITGDHHYTATSVARHVGMIPSNGKVFILQAESEFQHLSQSHSLDEHDYEYGMPSQPQSPDGRLSNSAYQALAGIQAKLTKIRAALRSSRSVHLTLHSGSQSASGSTSPQVTASSSFLSQQRSFSQRSFRAAWHPQSQGENRLLSFPRHSQKKLGDGLSPAGRLHVNTSHPASSSAHPQGQSVIPVSKSPLPVDIAGHPKQALLQIQHVVGHPKAMPGVPHSFQQPLMQPPDAATPLPGCEEDHYLPPGRPPVAPRHPQHLCQGLRLTLEGSVESCQGAECLEALASIAEGQAQCCVTGPVFAHLLQQADLSILETVMQNVVVFARMQSHQKGQVMELLGRRGLHQTVDGEHRHILVSLAFTSALPPFASYPSPPPFQPFTLLLPPFPCHLPFPLLFLPILPSLLSCVAACPPSFLCPCIPSCQDTVLVSNSCSA